jgi:hypothetical protein
VPICLFCKKDKGVQFTKVEHIIPESLGNNEYVLDKGVVCDKCNQYFSKLESYFCNYHLSSTHKLFTKYKTKKGKPPFLPLIEGEMRQDTTGKINFKQTLIPGLEHEQLTISFFEDDVAIRLAWPLPDSDSKKISRFLAKAGIETLYLKMKLFAFEKDFDFVRNYARFGGKKDFIPFLWCNQPHQHIDLYIGKFEFKKKGIFYFATIFLPGIVYLNPLNRTNEDYAIKALKDNLKIEKNCLNLCSKECLIKREPIELMALLSKKS